MLMNKFEFKREIYIVRSVGYIGNGVKKASNTASAVAAAAAARHK
jgi:hypothetical protein